MLRFNKLNKAFGNKQVLQNVGCHFNRGIFALQGPNGIGKTTLLSVLAGIVPADAGEIWIAGHSLHSAPLAAKSCLAYVPDECPIYPFMTGRELLKFVARAKQCEVEQRVWELVSDFGLCEHLNTPFGKMSLGTQKKTMLAAAQIGEPAVMLMDETSNALDHRTRHLLIELIKAKSEHNVILISTHDADFVNSVEATTITFDQLAERNKEIG
ncbi:MAG: ABC transporter ATP-binding protein [Methylococcales bacterium]|nr:ABC transporter ATP-binding protein [Methylococcaceae bacterium]